MAGNKTAISAGTDARENGWFSRTSVTGVCATAAAVAVVYFYMGDNDYPIIPGKLTLNRSAKNRLPPQQARESAIEDARRAGAELAAAEIQSRVKVSLEFFNSIVQLYKEGILHDSGLDVDNIETLDITTAGPLVIGSLKRTSSSMFGLDGSALGGGGLDDVGSIKVRPGNETGIFDMLQQHRIEEGTTGESDDYIIRLVTASDGKPVSDSEESELDKDAKRARKFAKIAREIMVSARTGLPDPNSNPRLRSALASARAANMPKDNIDRAMKRALGGDDGTVYEEVRYEGYGPGGIAVIVESMLHFDASKYDFDTVFEAAVEAGADNVETLDSIQEVTCSMDSFATVRDSLHEKLGDPVEAKIIWKPLNTIACDEDTAQTLIKLIDVLEDNDDVQNVYANFEISDEIADKLSA
eukprot:gene13508-13627_t